jgi:uncharacterized protein (DUF983 family)
MNNIVALCPSAISSKPRHNNFIKDYNMSLNRPLKPALRRGWRRCCPNCGKGALLYKYLKVHDSCNACGQDLYHHRADDGPAYLTILIVGHILAPLLHIVFVQFRPQPWIMALGFSTACVVLSLYFLPRIKGAIVAFQWARSLDGFGRDTSGNASKTN